MEYAFSTIKTILEHLKEKKVSSDEVLSYHLRRLELFNPQINAAIEIFDKNSIVKKSESGGVLHGIPGLIKDNICQEGRGVSCASRILNNFESTYDATACKRLKKAGAYLAGRANLDEFAMGSSTETSAFGKTKNPWNLERVPGGSSGGSAAAVSAGLVPWALGSDTGGSVRQPAAFCGIVGLKPTYGLVSRYGLVAYASSLDQIGVLTRSVYDNALILSIIAGQDTKDSSSLLVEQKSYMESLDGKLPEGLTIGIVENALEAEGIDDDIKSALEQTISAFEKMGARIKRISLDSIDYSAAAYFILSRAEAASNLARFDGVRYGFRNKEAHTLQRMYDETRHDGFGKEVRSRILVGNYALSASHASDYYENAKKVKRLIRADFVEAFKDVNLLFMPTHPVPAFRFGAFDVNPLQMDLQDYFTCPVNLAGVPAISLPCGFTRSQMPIGFQLIGPHLSEELIYRAAYAYEQSAPWHTMHPTGFNP